MLLNGVNRGVTDGGGGGRGGQDPALLKTAGVHRRGSRISARVGRQGNDDLIWDWNERFLT